MAGIYDALQVLIGLQIAQVSGGKQKYKPEFYRRPGDDKTTGKRRVSPRQLAMMMKGR